jgi:hypothetical protein
MPTRNTGTPITDVNGNNATLTHLSTNILIKVDGAVVGATQSFSINEQRSIKMIPEIGTDGFIDSAPNASTDISGSISRVRYAKKRLFESLGRGFIHVHAQRIPFDIEVQDIFADNDGAHSIITIIKNVWFERLNFTYSATDFVIQEETSWKAERIYSLLNNGNVVTSVGNGNGQPIILNQFELEADRGAFTGSLDAANLINAFLDDPRV